MTLLQVHGVDEPRSFRASVIKSDHGKWAMKSHEMAKFVGEGISLFAEECWPIDLVHCHLDVVCVLTSSPRTAYLGLALSDVDSANSRSHTVFGPTALQTHIAFSMVSLASIQPGQTVFDPMCGCGTIPYEVSLAHPQTTVLACDRSGRAVRAAQANFLSLNTHRITLFRSDAARLPLKASTVDAIISDLPWGRRSGSYAANQRVYPNLFREWARVVRCGGVVVVLTLERGIMRSIEKNFCLIVPFFTMEAQRVVDSGYMAMAYTMRRTGHPWAPWQPGLIKTGSSTKATESTATDEPL